MVSLRYLIGTRLKQGLKGILNNLKVDLAQFVFLTKPRQLSVADSTAINAGAIAPAAWRYSPRSFASLLFACACTRPKRPTRAAANPLCCFPCASQGDF